jgi:hypothetical protein
MKFIPFPPTLARISAETGRRLQTSDQDDAGRHRPRSSLPQPYVANAVSAYRWPDGRVAPAHDMYAPQHPEGAEPGLARIKYEVRHHPNDTSSYHPNILTFRSVPDLEAEGMIIDQTAVGLLRHEGRAALIVTPDETAMTELAQHFPEGSDLVRGVIRRVGPETEPMRHFLATNSVGGGFEAMGATLETDLFAAATARFSFIPETPDYAEFCAILRKHGTKNGWVVAATTLDEIPETMSYYMGVRTELNARHEEPGP